MTDSWDPSLKDLTGHDDRYNRSWYTEQAIGAAEWSNRYRYISQKASSEFGKMSLDRTPYLKEILDCLSSSSPVQEVAFMKSARIGGSEAGFSWIGWIIDQKPANILYLTPTGEFSKRISKTSLGPLLEETPVLKEKLGTVKNKEKSDNLTNKSFPNGELFISNATGANLRGLTIKYVYCDEVDAYPMEIVTNSESEGDVIDLVKNRTATYGFHKKLYYVSTPTTYGSSKIHDLYQKGDQRLWYMPCPSCSENITLRFQGLKWPKGRPEDVYYECEHCQFHIIEELHKTEMLEKGEWIAQNPGAGRGLFASFHLNALAAPYPWKTWVEIAAQWEDANRGNNQIKLKTFIQTVLGEVWREKGEVPSWERLFNRRSDLKSGICPKGSLLLTAGIDIQKDRAALEIKSWMPDLQSASIWYEEIWGDTSHIGSEVWAKLEERINATYPIDGMTARLSVEKAAIDIGYNTGIVYAWARRNRRNVAAIKGTDSSGYVISLPQKVDVNDLGRRSYRSLKVWQVGTGLVKPELYGWLNQEQPTDDNYPPGYVHFPCDREEEYFKQLCGEQIVSKLDKRTGRIKYEWVKVRARQEALDTSVYARAAASISGIDRWSKTYIEELQDEIYGAAADIPQYVEPEKDDDDEEYEPVTTINPDPDSFTFMRDDYW